MRRSGSDVLISTHKKETTTPAIRSAFQSAAGSVDEVSRPFNVTRDTTRKWRKRANMHDANHTTHRLQTTLTFGQEESVIYLSTHLLLTLDDLLAVVREYIEPAMSHSAMDHLLRRYGHARPQLPDKRASTVKPFKAHEPGYLNADLKYLPQITDETARR